MFFIAMFFLRVGLVLRHINYIEIMILAVHYSGRPILVLETLDIRLLQLKNY